MGVNATTAESFGVWSTQGASAEGLARVNALIPVVSRQIERYLGREIELKARVEDYSLRQFQRTVLLRNAPVTELTSVSFDPRARFDGSGGNDFDVNLDPETGLLHILDELGEWGPNSLRVSYTGGIAATAEDVVANYPDIAHAANLQLGHILERRVNPGARRDVSAVGGATYTGEVDLLKYAKQLLHPYRRIRLT